MNYAFLITTIAVVIGFLAIATIGKVQLTNEQYDRLKSLVVKWHYITGFIALIAKTFDMPYGAETVSIVIGFGVMLAGLLGISNENYEGEKITDMFNADLLKDMLGFDEDMHLLGELESEAEDEIEEEESEA